MLNDYFHAYVIIDFLTNLSVFLIRSHIRLGQFYFIFPIKVSLEPGRLETISVLINMHSINHIQVQNVEFYYIALLHFIKDVFPTVRQKLQP